MGESHSKTKDLFKAVYKPAIYKLTKGYDQEIKELGQRWSPWMHNELPQILGSYNKISGPSTEYFLITCWPESTERLLKQQKLLPMLLTAHQILLFKAHFDIKILISKPEASFVLASLNNTRSYYAECLERKMISDLTQLSSEYSNTEQPGTIDHLVK